MNSESKLTYLREKMSTKLKIILIIIIEIAVVYTTFYRFQGKTLFHINKEPNDNEVLENNKAYYTYQFT